MAANLNKCAEISQPTFFGGTFYGNKNEWRFADGAYYFAGTDARVPFMFRIEAKDVSLGRKGLVETEFNKVFSSGTQKEPQKDGVYYEEKFYGKKEDWKFESGAFSGKKWVYKGTDSEVQPSMKTTGLSIEEKLRLFGPPGEE